MPRSVPERDWKVFRELRVVALERLCERILAEAKAEIGRSEQSAHAKYLNVFELIRRRDHDIARGFNGLRRSTALRQAGIIHSMGLLTAEELRRFSDETIALLEMYAPIPESDEKLPGDPGSSARAKFAP